jgi:hypothetical protein
VVAIWKDFESYDELDNERKSNVTHDGFLRKISIEIRWFYERNEIVGVSNSDATTESDELFETDHVDLIDAAKSLLAPAMLRTDSKSTTESDNYMGIPIQKFVCRRFWSTTRKSLIPCGTLEGRQKRGWVYSKCLPEEMQRKSIEADTCSPDDSRLGNCANLTWKESMTRIISKLTLKDASRGAYERGEALIGREKEIHQLLFFFRAAIRGDPGTGGVKSSMFIAGPPGVGKVRNSVKKREIENYFVLIS